MSPPTAAGGKQRAFLFGDAQRFRGDKFSVRLGGVAILPPESTRGKPVRVSTNVVHFRFTAKLQNAAYYQNGTGYLLPNRSLGK